MNKLQDLTSNPWIARIALAGLMALLLGVIGQGGVEHLLKMWERDEYSHGYLIPVVALYLIWQKRAILSAEIGKPSWLGVALMIFALLLWALGEASAMNYFVDYSLWIGIVAISLLIVGFSGSRAIMGPLFYFFFMIPLPGFLYARLSNSLQLISSELGVAVIRFFDISVFLEGNVIDLGTYQLQVVEACSGLRYLFPLMSFGFLIAYIYRAPMWRRIFVFLSTIPITVLMNSFRIGFIGITVEHFGIAAAEGFLHDFEGWVVFMACLGVLLLEIYVLYLIFDRPRTFSSMLDLDFGSNEKPQSTVGETNSVALYTPPFVIGLVLLFAAVPASINFVEREDLVPERTSFATYPMRIDSWAGRQSALSKAELDILQLSDYWIANYRKDKSNEPPVNLYMAWYESQRKEASIHSPKACLPGGGWKIESHTKPELAEFKAHDGSALKVNRFLMKQDGQYQVVYYWFHGRGRNITDENIAKFYLFWDSLTQRRTDGALVRLITYVPSIDELDAADERLQDFLRDFYPTFQDYIPD